MCPRDERCPTHAGDSTGTVGELGRNITALVCVGGLELVLRHSFFRKRHPTSAVKRICYEACSKRKRNAMAIFKDLFPAKHRDHGEDDTSRHDSTSMSRRRRHRRRRRRTGHEHHGWGY